MKSDRKSWLASDMNSIHSFLHMRQYTQKKTLLTCFNFTDAEDVFSLACAFSLHLKYYTSDYWRWS